MKRQRRNVPLSREPVEVTIDGFTHGGDGVARVEGKAVFVPGTIPGERVVIRVTDDRARWARGQVVEVADASPDRIPTPVPDAADWGGCDLLHIEPAAARVLKTRVVREQLTRLGKLTDPPVAACRAVGPDRHYRNHVQLHVGPDGELGFHRTGSHEVVPADRCPVMTDAVRSVVSRIGTTTGASRIAVRAHPSTGTSAIVLTPGPGGLDLPGGDADLLLEQPDGSTVTMRGDGILAEEVAGLTFRFDATSFFQVNTGGAAALVDAVLESCGDVRGALTWDLYSGVGLLSLPLVRAGAEVVAVEGHEPSAGWARTNAGSHGFELAVLAEPVGDVVRRARPSVTAALDGPPKPEPPDIVVLDPPRVGAGEDVVTALVELAPATIVYVACDVAALARDTRHLAEGGYRLTQALPLDLFPLTHHVEVVATFSR